MFKICLGIDVSSAKFDVCLVGLKFDQAIKVIASKSKITNSLSGFEQLNRWLQSKLKDKTIPLVITLEATGIYYESLAYYLKDQGYDICVVLGNRSRKFLQGIGTMTKNDKVDAKGLGIMGATIKLETWQPPGPFYRKLRGLTRQNQLLKEQRVQLKNQLHAEKNSAFPNNMTINQLEQIVDLIDSQIKDNELAIEKHMASDKKVWDKANRIFQIKGVGILTIAICLAETQGFSLIRNYKQLISYAGYDVIENQSGKRQGKTRISKRGNSRIRRILYFPALNVVKYEQKPFFNLYLRTFDRHKVKMKSYVAVQKKLLTTIYAMWLNGEDWNSEHSIKFYMQNKKAS